MRMRTLMAALTAAPLLMGTTTFGNVISFDFGREHPQDSGSDVQASNALQGADSLPATEFWGSVAADDFTNYGAIVTTHEGVTLSVGDTDSVTWSGASRDRGGTDFLRPNGSVDLGPQSDKFDVLRDFIWESGQSDDGWLEMNLSGLLINKTYTLRAWFFEASTGSGAIPRSMTIWDDVAGNQIATVNQDYANPDNSFVDFQMTSDASGEIFMVASDATDIFQGGRLNGLEILDAPLPLEGDFNNDGFVGIADLNLVLGNWNAGIPPAGGNAAIPEPASMALLGMGAVALLRRR